MFLWWFFCWAFFLSFGPGEFDGPLFICITFKIEIICCKRSLVSHAGKLLDLKGYSRLLLYFPCSTYMYYSKCTPLGQRYIFAELDNPTLCLYAFLPT